MGSSDLSVKRVVANLLITHMPKVIDKETPELSERLLRERISLAGIAHVLQVSEQWLLSLRH